ncbi:DNA primase [Escherichia coli]|nr:DNA primase [Escherichia coli]
MKMNVTATVSHALGHWPRILPALGIQVLKNRHQPCPSVAGVTASVLMTGRARHLVLQSVSVPVTPETG